MCNIEIPSPESYFLTGMQFLIALIYTVLCQVRSNATYSADPFTENERSMYCSS